MADNGKKKLIWTILFSVITIVLCYLFIVVYFYFINPYNISMRLTFWPFVSERQVGEMYNEATVDVAFTYINEETDEEETISATGVNVNQNGFIILPYSEIALCEDFSKIKVQTRGGATYEGNFLYASREFNIAIVKCETAANRKSINIPYVTLTSSYYNNDKVFVSSQDISDNSSWVGEIVDCEGYSFVSTKEYFYCIEDGFTITVNGDFSFKGGAVFDRSAHLIGFSYKDTVEFDSNSTTLSENKEHYIMPTYPAKLVIDDVINAYNNNQTYENRLVDAFVGVDYKEASTLTIAENLKDGKIYYHNKYYEITDEIDYFVNSNVEGFLLLEKFVYNETSINASAVIYEIYVGDEKFEICNKLDFYIVVNALEKGDNVRINFKVLNGAGTGYNLETKMFKV